MKTVTSLPCLLTKPLGVSNHVPLVLNPFISSLENCCSGSASCASDGSGGDGHLRPVALIRKLFICYRSPSLFMGLSLLITLLITSPLFAQQSVGIGTTTPDNSAALEIKSEDKGLLIPRMNSQARSGITTPADGLMVFDTDENAFYYYANGSWTELAAPIQFSPSSPPSYLIDTDGDTKIQVESNQDEDIIRFTLMDTERMTLTENISGQARLEMPNNSGNTFVGESAGNANTTGYNNTFYGHSSGLRNTDSDNNTFIGHSAGVNNTTGVHNIFMGAGSGAANLSGNQNVYLGFEAGASGNSSSSNICIGYRAGQQESGSNRLYIENSNNASSAALIYGEFDNNLLALNATVGIGTNTPAATAALDISASEKGLLIPRMNSSVRQGISNPAEGLLVFDNTVKAFYYHANSAWTQIGTSHLLADTDGNTRIQVEESANENIIRFDLNGTEKMVLRQNTNGLSRLEMPNNQSSIFIGDNTGRNAAPPAEFNVVLGYHAAYNNFSGSSNTILGAFAGDSISNGNENTLVGYFSGNDNTTGNYNTFLGSSAGFQNRTGSNNVYIGRYSGANNPGGSGNVFIGNEAGRSETNSNRLYIENSNANSSTALIYGEFDNNLLTLNASVGIATTNPHASAALDIESADRGLLIPRMDSATRENISSPAEGLMVYDNTAQAFYYYNQSTWMELATQSTPAFLSDADGNTKIHVEESSNEDIIRFNVNSTPRIVMDEKELEITGVGSAKLKVGGTTNGVDVHHIASNRDMVFNADTTNMQPNDALFVFRASDYNALASYSPRMMILRNGNVGIGTIIAPTARLEIDGDARKPQGGSWAGPSDRRLKQDINPYTDGLEEVLAIRPVTYHYNKTSGYDTEPEYVGVIAQELQEVAPYMVDTYQKQDTEYLEVDNSAMIYMLINAVQEQQNIIARHQAEQKQILERLAILEAQVQTQPLPTEQALNE